MNYRHIYHAGNFADVYKHAVLVFLLDHLRQKDKPFFVLDTHAGIGGYDLQSVEAQKTGDAAAGIDLVWRKTDAIPALSEYLDVVRRLNGYRDALRYYPGSPLIIKSMLRDHDRLIANEWHPEDVVTLQKNLGPDARVKITHEDGYIIWKAQMPPAERRGLVLVDPPFEVRNEFDLMLRGLREAYKRWATGMYALWYPIKDRAAIDAFHRALAATGIPKIWAAHFMIRSPVDEMKFNGCGLVLVNPPWTLPARLETLGPELARIFSTSNTRPFQEIVMVGNG